MIDHWKKYLADQLVYRAMLLRALQDWREFGTLVFVDRWLR